MKTVDTRSSPLGALFRWRSSSKKTNLENFCTEALATAIASRPQPFIRLVADLNLLPPGVSVNAIATVTIATQEPIEEGKIPDLQLELDLTDGTKAGLWLEVKVGAGLGNNQLDHYTAALAQRYDTAPRRLLVLSRRPEQPTEHNLRWQQIYAAIEQEQDPRWSELRIFLEEQNVADRYDEALTDADLDAIAGGHRTLRKVGRAMALLAERLTQDDDAKPLKPAGFPIREEKILQLIANTFRHGWGMVIGGHRNGPRLRLGVRDTETGPEAFVMVQVRRSHTKTRNALWAKLDAAAPSLGPVVSGRWDARGIRRPLAELADHDALATFWLDGLRSIHKAGVLPLCGTAFSSDEDDPSDDAEDD